MKHIKQIAIILTMLFSLTTCDSVAAFLRGLDAGLLSGEGLIPDGTAFFVGKNGNDNNTDGLSAAKPFKTFDKAVQAAAGHAAIKRVAVIGTLTESESLSTDSNSTFFVVATSSDEVTVIGHGRNAVLAAATGKRVIRLSNDSLPLVFSNITLSGGAADTGAGLYIGVNRTVVLEEGTTITNCESTGLGGGVYIGTGGTLTMNGGSIQFNSATSSGGGVCASIASFTMNGGNIRNNSATYGGGVASSGSDGTFTMNSGNIQGNSATADIGSGGGVYVSAGNFIMTGGVIQDNFTRVVGGGGVSGDAGAKLTLSGGIIKNNTAGTFLLFNNSDGNGGGVFMKSGSTLVLTDGCILQNNIATNGGGVYVAASTFTMAGGTISGAGSTKTAEKGGGVYVTGSIGKFIMQAGVIQEHTVAFGGGVYIFGDATFTMDDGEIRANSATSLGGGVYALINTAKFSKTGGTIFGKDGGDDANRAPTDLAGHAVYATDLPFKYRDTTADKTVPLNNSNMTNWNQ